MTIFVIWHLILTLDNIRNSCDVYGMGLAANLKVASAAKSFPQILFPAKCQNTSKFCITTQLPPQRHRLSGKHSSKTSPITPHYERSQASNQVFRSVFQEGRWNFDPTELIPEIVRIFNLPRTTVLISRKPPNLTQPIFNQVAFNCQPGF